MKFDGTLATGMRNSRDKSNSTGSVGRRGKYVTIIETYSQHFFINCSHYDMNCNFLVNFFGWCLKWKCPWSMCNLWLEDVWAFSKVYISNHWNSYKVHVSYLAEGVRVFLSLKKWKEKNQISSISPLFIISHIKHIASVFTVSPIATYIEQLNICIYYWSVILQYYLQYVHMSYQLLL